MCIRDRDKRDVRTQGFDIVLAIDLSGSMLSEDYENDGERINRLRAIKPVIQAFIEQRPSDRIGVVLFSSKAYTLSPLTTDHVWLGRQIERIRIGLITDGTAIGDALGVALTRLDQSKREQDGRRKGAFIVLLTDGANNMGALTPVQSAQLAKARGVPIYTIGAGKDGLVPYPNFDDKMCIRDRSFPMRSAPRAPPALGARSSFAASLKWPTWLSTAISASSKS